jgi:hypothetical protein
MIYVSNTYLQKSVSCVCQVNTYTPQNDLYYGDDLISVNCRNLLLATDHNLFLLLMPSMQVQTKMQFHDCSVCLVKNTILHREITYSPQNNLCDGDDIYFNFDATIFCELP